MSHSSSSAPAQKTAHDATPATAPTAKHVWHFMQSGGLLQLKITSIDDVLNLKELDPKLWVALACPVKGLEYSEETLELLDTDHNGRVRLPEVLQAVTYIRTHLKEPAVIMTEGSSIPLTALGESPFDCGHSPQESARAVLHILGNDSASEISLEDVTASEKLFAPNVINGDGVLPPDVFADEELQAVVKDIIACTGGKDDVSGVKGITREQTTAFFADLRAVRTWRDEAQAAAPSIFFLKDATESAFAAYERVRDKINDYFLRCSLASYNSGMSEAAAAALHAREEELLALSLLSEEALSSPPLAAPHAEKVLIFDEKLNPVWKAALDEFALRVLEPLLGAGNTTRLTEATWKQITAAFAPYEAWCAARPANTVSAVGFERVDELLASSAEEALFAQFDKEDAHPPLALAAKELKKLLLLRRDFVTLLRNFVSFEDFYAMDSKKPAVFQCGTLYIDGRATTLCFRVLDSAKHAALSPLSQCYLLYCDCKRPSENRTMQIAALISAGSRDNLIVGRNGLFYDRDGNDWDCTVTKIVENPISIREAFWMPYKKVSRMIQERVAKRAAESETAVNAKLSQAVEKPGEAAAATAADGAKKFDVGTIAALGVAVSGFTAVIGTVLGILTRQWWMPPVFVVGLILLISLPSMVLAWLKLRERNIAPILDASGWAVNGNVRITIPLGALLTTMRRRPRNSKLNALDPYAEKRFPWVRTVLCLVLLAAVCGGIALLAHCGWNVRSAWAACTALFS